MRHALLVLLLTLAATAMAQVRQPKNALRSLQQDRLVPAPEAQEQLRASLREIETGLQKGSTSALATKLGPTVQVNLPGQGRGDYSSNQAYQLLSGFFAHRSIQFASIDRIESAVASPYASGIIVAGDSGRDTLRLYLSFASVDSRWLITHFSLY